MIIIQENISTYISTETIVKETTNTGQSTEA